MFAGDVEDAGLAEAKLFISIRVEDGDVSARYDAADGARMIGRTDGDSDGAEAFADAVAIAHFDMGAVVGEVFDDFFGSVFFETLAAGNAHFDR